MDLSIFIPDKNWKQVFVCQFLFAVHLSLFCLVSGMHILLNSFGTPILCLLPNYFWHGVIASGYMMPQADAKMTPHIFCGFNCEHTGLEHSVQSDSCKVNPEAQMDDHGKELSYRFGWDHRTRHNNLRQKRHLFCKNKMPMHMWENKYLANWIALREGEFTPKWIIPISTEIRLLFICRKWIDPNKDHNQKRHWPTSIRAEFSKPNKRGEKWTDEQETLQFPFASAQKERTERHYQETSWRPEGLGSFYS